MCDTFSLVLNLSGYKIGLVCTQEWPVPSVVTQECHACLLWRSWRDFSIIRLLLYKFPSPLQPFNRLVLPVCSSRPLAVGELSENGSDPFVSFARFVSARFAF